MGWSPRCYIPCFVEIGPQVPEKKIFEGFYHIWAWRPSWSCDPDAANKLSFPLPKEALHKIWLWLAKRFQRRRCLKLWTTDDDGRTPDHGYTISSPLSLRLRWAKNQNSNIRIAHQVKVHPLTPPLLYEPQHQKTALRGFQPDLTQTGLDNHWRWLGTWNFGFRKQRDCTIQVGKTKALISFAVTVKLICVFVLAYAKIRFSHVVAHITMTPWRYILHLHWVK